jgi:hypothetical protein
MIVSDLTVEVRNSSLARVGQILESDLVGSSFVPRFNNVGAWKILLRASHPMADILRTPGSGIIVTLAGTVILSGPTVTARSTKTSQDPEGVWEIEGSDDSILLANRVAYPTPSTADVTAQTNDYDTRTGAAETVIKAYVNANIGPSAPVARRVPALAIQADSARGDTVTGKARFDRLGVLLESLAVTSGLGFTIDQNGAVLTFRIFEPTDRSATIRMDVENERLEKSEYAYARPTVTRVIVAGQGAGVDRTFVEVSSVASLAAESDWSQRIEVFKDQRNTDDNGELIQAGDEILADGGMTVRSVSVSPSDDQTMRYGSDWGLGDRVTVVVGDEQVSQIVTEVAIVITKDGVKVGATVGDPKVASAYDSESATAQTTVNQEERISSLERNEPPAPTPAPDLSGLAPLASPTFTGVATSPVIRLTDATEATLTSTGHALQIGPTSGINLVADANEIMSRNNGAVTTLSIQPDGGSSSISPDGGTVILGNASSMVTVAGTLTAPNLASRNFLINGGFDFWQRGTSSTANSVYIADRWIHSRAAGTHTASRSTDVPTDAGVGFSFSMASTSGTAPAIVQRIESVNSSQFAGQTVTLSVWAKSTVGTGALAWTSAYPTATDNWGSETADTSGTFAASMTVGTWTRYTATFTANALATRGYRVSIYRNVTTTSTTTLYAGAQLEFGSVATRFARAGATYTEEQMACFRYYQRHITITGRTDNTNVWKIIGNPLGELLRATPSSVIVGTISTPGSGGNIGTNVTLTLSGRDMYYTSTGSSSNGAWLNFDDVKIECEL